MKRNRMKHIALLGSFSGRNKGDLAVLRTELMQLKTRAREQLTVYIFTKDTRRLREYLSDIIADEANRSKLNIKIFRGLTSYIGPKTLPILAKCNKVIIGGGGLFFDNRLFDISFSHLLNIFIIALLLKWLGKDLMIYAVGCSHLNSRAARWMTRFVVNNAKIVSVRDRLSKMIFSECSDREIVLGSDPAFLLGPKKTARAEKIAESWPKGGKILLSLLELIFIRKDVPEPQNALKQFLVQVHEFAERNGYFVLTYTNYTSQKFASKIAKLCGKSARTMLEGENHLLPEEIVYLFSKVDFVITAQLHVGISSYLAGVPFVSLIYDDKVEEFNKRIGSQNYLSLTEMSDSVKVAKALSVVAGSRPIPRNAAVQTDSEKLAEMLNKFVWD